MIVLDTSLFYAVFDEQDKNHDQAQTIFRRIFNGEFAQPVLIDYVYNELLTLTYVRTKQFENCQRLSKLIDEFIKNKRLTLMHTPPEIFWKGNEIYLEQKLEDQSRFLSFTDAIIGAMAIWLQATHIGTFDSQFHRFPVEIVSE